MSEKATNKKDTQMMMVQVPDLPTTTFYLFSRNQQFMACGWTITSWYL